MARYTRPVTSADAAWIAHRKSYNIGSTWFPAATDYQDKFRIPVHYCVVSPLPLPHPLPFLRSDIQSVSVLVITILIPDPSLHFCWQVHLACPHSVSVPRNGFYEWTRLSTPHILEAEDEERGLKKSRHESRADYWGGKWEEKEARHLEVNARIAVSRCRAGTESEQSADCVYKDPAQRSAGSRAR